MPPVQSPQERQFERLQKLEGHHVTVNTRKSVQRDSSGNNDHISTLRVIIE